MTDLQIAYYHRMLEQKRLLPITLDGKLKGLITFYIGDKEDENKFIRENPWEFVSDEPETGTVCFVDQLITNKEKENPRYSFIVWDNFKSYIKEHFSQVRFVRWNRYKKGVRYVLIDFLK